MEDRQLPELIRNFVIEMVVYAILVIVYFLLVLRFLQGYLYDLFAENLTVYGIVSLVLVVAQGVLLDFITSYLLDRVKLSRLK